ncbi:follistatin-like [Ylistrum balloti]|uniref:follistatin-like n=1 Tax=Ylistrum balloti TaxID=509963 RepID=UPI002905EF9D|nr:follistatin-like [Ylistrum balloti]
MILCFRLMDTYATCHCSIHLILLVSWAGYASGGLCWANISPSNSCSTLYRANITREDCCRTFSPSIGWSPSDLLTNGQVFYWKALMKSVSHCQRCHNSCANIRCAPGRVCRMRKGVPKCVCRPRCTNEMRKRGSLCGTDSVNYKNYCHMLKRNCRKNQQTHVAYFGKCKRACKRVKCLTGTQCLEDQNGLPHCVRCRSVCPAVTNPNYVCGDDQVSYPSVCHVRASICSRQTPIRITVVRKRDFNRTCKKCRRKKRRKHRRKQRRYKTSIGYYKVNVYNPQKSGKSEQILKLQIISDANSLSRDVS